MAKFNVMDVTWEKVEVLGREALFTRLRVDRHTVPEGWYLYEVRHGNYGEPIEIALGVLVNHLGTLLTKEPINLESSTRSDNAYLDIDPKTDWKFLEESIRF